MRPKIACIATEYRPRSHADVIITKLLEGYQFQERYRPPRVDVASLYLDQVPEKDMGRKMAATFQVPVFATIRDALTLGTGRLGVDGVVIIGEHGDYPRNEKKQHLYPRKEFFDQVVAVFRDSGRSVPVFCDKHLSWNREWAGQMYRDSQALGFAFMAGSTVPLAWRRPPLTIAPGTAIEEALCASYGPLESYGFHALEGLQCMVEARGNGETGIAAAQCLAGDEVWRAADAGRFPADLLETALARCETRLPGPPRENCKGRELYGFLLEYRDGLRGTVLLLNGHITEWAVAARLRGRQEPVSTQIWMQGHSPHNHFANLVHHITEMFLTGRAQTPVERTLLVTGALAWLIESHFAGGKRLETPDLNIQYRW